MCEYVVNISKLASTTKILRKLYKNATKNVFWPFLQKNENKG